VGKNEFVSNVRAVLVWVFGICEVEKRGKELTKFCILRNKWDSIQQAENLHVEVKGHFNTTTRRTCSALRYFTNHELARNNEHHAACGDEPAPIARLEGEIEFPVFRWQMRSKDDLDIIVSSRRLTPSRPRHVQPCPDSLTAANALTMTS
jgi:hypothetical protein